MNLERAYDLDETPVFVRAGSIITMRPEDKPLFGSAQQQYNTLLLRVYPEASTPKKTTTLYEDDGITDKYVKASAYALTDISYELLNNGKSVRVTIEILGPHLPPKMVVHDGQSLPTSSWSYEGNRLCTSVLIKNIKTSEATTVEVVYSENVGVASQQNDIVRCISRAEKAKELLDQQWNKNVFPEDYYCVLDAAETGDRISANPGNSTTEIKTLHNLCKESVNVLNNYAPLEASVRKRLVALFGTC